MVIKKAIRFLIYSFFVIVAIGAWHAFTLYQEVYAGPKKAFQEALAKAEIGDTEAQILVGIYLTDEKNAKSAWV